MSHTHTQACTYTHMCTHTHTHSLTHIYAHTPLHLPPSQPFPLPNFQCTAALPAEVCVCVCVCVHALCMCDCVCAHPHPELLKLLKKHYQEHPMCARARVLGNCERAAGCRVHDRACASVAMYQWHNARCPSPPSHTQMRRSALSMCLWQSCRFVTLMMA